MALHPAAVPEEEAEFAVERIDAPAPAHGQEPLQARHDLGLGLAGLVAAGPRGAGRLGCQVVREGGRDDEVAVGEPLHEG